MHVNVWIGIGGGTTMKSLLEKLEEAINGDKTNRIAAIRSLIKLLPDASIIDVLDKVRTSEKIWYLRREARIAFEIIKDQ